MSEQPEQPKQSEQPEQPEQLYFYSASVADIFTKDGQPLPPFDNHPIQFIASVEKAQGQFFILGYILESEKGLFEDNKERYVYDSFVTTDGTNSTEDDVPNRLSILLKESPYNGIPIDDLRFGVLHVHRYIQPQQGGRRKRTGGTRRSRRSLRITRRHRSKR